MLSTSTTSAIVLLVVALDNVEDALCQKNSFPTAKSTAPLLATLPPPSPAVNLSTSPSLAPPLASDMVIKILHRLGFAEAGA